MIVTPVPAGDVARLIPALQATLVELLDLSLLTKQLHWCVQGDVAFLPVHRMLDELVDFARESYDTVAERIVQLGAFPDGRSRTVAISSPLVQPDVAPVDPCQVPAFVALNLIGEALRVHQRTIDAVVDPVTQNILIDIGQELGKLSWFWQASQGDDA